MESLPKPLQDVMDRVGWLVTGVEEFDFAYTVGLIEKYGHPEIIIQGLRCQLAYQLIHVIVENIKNGAKYIPGRDYDDIAKGLPARFVFVHYENELNWMGVATQYNGEKMMALQMVWCDTEGKFPWDANSEFEGRFKDRQILFNDIVPYPESNHQCDHNCALHKSNTTVQ